MDFIETNILIDAMMGKEGRAKDRLRTMPPNERERLMRAMWQACDWIAEVDDETVDEHSVTRRTPVEAK